jgi:hypothetical protein
MARQGADKSMGVEARDVKEGECWNQDSNTRRGAGTTFQKSSRISTKISTLKWHEIGEIERTTDENR